MGEGAPALWPEADTSVIMPEESAFESAQLTSLQAEIHAPAVEAFMRHLSEYLHSSNIKSRRCPRTTRPKSS